MYIPSLEEDDAIAILVGSTSTLGEEDKSSALKRANRCAFQERPRSDNGTRDVRRFHPLALKAFGSYLSDRFGANLSKWVAEFDGLVGGSLYGLNGVFALLDITLNDMGPEHRMIFMLLAVYIPPNMPPYNVTNWLAMSSNESIISVEEAVESLCKKAFIEEFNPEIRIHDLYIKFAQSKANKMGRWLCWKGDEPRGFISQDYQGFELAKMERCMHRDPSQILPKFRQNLLLLQLVGIQNMRKLGLAGMDCLRSITLHDCKVLEALEGMENLVNLAWVQIRGVDKMLKLPKLSSFSGLQYLEIDVAVSQVISQLGDLTPCSLLQEMNVRCPSLLEFPKLNGLLHLEKVEFSMCDKVKGPLDCTGCVELQSIVLNSCCQMATPPRIAGCNEVSKIVLFQCYAVRECQDMDVSSALKKLELHISSYSWSVPKSLKSCCKLESLQLWNMGRLRLLPSFRSLSNLTVLEIGKCGITEPPDLTCCLLLEEVV